MSAKQINITKSEREKMLAGEFYNPRDPELQAMAQKGRKLVAELLRLDYTDEAGHDRVLTQLLAKAGQGAWIEPPFFCDYGNNIYLGDRSYVNANCVFLDCGKIIIGNDVLLAPSVQIYAVTHPVLVSERIIEASEECDSFTSYTREVHIADRCWIGGGTIILPGVHIGEGTTIGAGSVVTKDIPANVLAFGNPCRVVRKLI